MRGNGSIKRPVRPQIRQRSHTPGLFCGPRGCTTAPDRSGLFTGLASAGPPSDNAEQMIGMNPDPSRRLARGDLDSAADDRDDRAVLRDSAGNADWHSAAAGAGLGCDRISCNTGVRDHTAGRERTRRDKGRLGKPAAGEPLRLNPPCVIAGGTGQWTVVRGRLEPACNWSPDEGCQTETPPLLRWGFLVNSAVYATVHCWELDG